MQSNENVRAADAIVESLAEQIISGQLKDRDPLPAERELIEEFGASRIVIREAISVLSNRGLLVSKPRHRPIVRKPDYTTVLSATGDIVRYLLNEPNGIKNLYDSRVFMERGLVRQAALSASKDDIHALKNALRANEDAIDDSDEFYRTDTAFHGVLYRIPKNPIFPAVHQGYTSWLSPQWGQMLRSPERNVINFQAHKEILDAILERDADAAEAAIESHLKAAWEFVRVTFNLGDA